LRRKLGKEVWQFFPYDARNTLQEAQQDAHRHQVQAVDEEVAIAPMFAQPHTKIREFLRVPPQL
jgi:hypothetical protein